MNMHDVQKFAEMKAHEMRNGHLSKEDRHMTAPISHIRNVYDKMYHSPENEQLKEHR